jgi:hypothetical protein
MRILVNFMAMVRVHRQMLYSRDWTHVFMIPPFLY